MSDPDNNKNDWILLHERIPFTLLNFVVHFLYIILFQLFNLFTQHQALMINLNVI